MELLFVRLDSNPTQLQSAVAVLEHDESFDDDANFGCFAAQMRASPRPTMTRARLFSSCPSERTFAELQLRWWPVSTEIDGRFSPSSVFGIGLNNGKVRTGARLLPNPSDEMYLYSSSPILTLPRASPSTSPIVSSGRRLGLGGVSSATENLADRPNIPSTDLNGDPIPEGKLGSPDFDLGAWFGKHGSDVTRPPLDKVIAALKAKGVTSFAATGYCLGGRYVADLVLDDVLKVAIVAHPSLIKVPEDLEAIKKHSVPFLWNTCEVDQYVSLSSVTSTMQC